MDRRVVNHGDCHGSQFLHRGKAESEGLMLIDFDQAIDAPAWYDWGCPLFQYFVENLDPDESKDEETGKMVKKTPYPSLERRTLAAQAYLDAIGGEEAANYPGSTIEDVLFDVNKGFVGRMLFISFISGMSGGLNQHPSYFTWMILAVAENASNLLKKAMRGDAALKAEIVKSGIVDVTMDSITKNLGADSWKHSMALFEEDPKMCAPKISALPLGPINGTTTEHESCGCVMQ